MKWGCFLWDSLDHRRDVAELGAHAGFDNHRRASPVGDRRAHEDHVDLVSHGSIELCQRTGRFLDGHRLTGECRLLDLEVDRFHQATIRRDPGAHFEQDDVAGNQVGGRDLANVAVAADAHGRHCQLLEGGHRPLRPVLLDEPQRGVQHDDGQDHDGVLKVAQESRDDGGDNEDDDHDAGQLFPQDHEG